MAVPGSDPQRRCVWGPVAFTGPLSKEPLVLIAFFIVAGLAALAFLAAGIMKVVRPKPALKANGLEWVDDFSAATVKLIGLAEILGAIGLILPVAVNVVPILSPIAGIAVAVIMIGAVVVHRRRKESPVPSVVLTLLAIAAAVLGFIVIA
jgi:uncharacterized membrane protein